MSDERRDGNKLWKWLAILGLGSIGGMGCLLLIITAIIGSYVMLAFMSVDDGHSDMRAAGGHTLSLNEGDVHSDEWGGTSGRAPDAGN